MRIVRGLRLQGRVDIRDPVSHFDMPEIYAEATMVVLASRIEGLGKALLEGGSVGRPSVAPSVGGIPDIVRDGVNGLLFPRDSLKDFIDGISYLLDNPDEARRMGRRARKIVERHFTWEDVSRRHDDLYEKILEGG
jgi:glycosyltransferase involved in cell wall biosynthesis